MKTVRLFMVLMAFACLSSSAAFAQTAPWEYQRENANVPIVDFGTASSSITINDNFTISDLEVMVDIQHTAVGDLLVMLTGPYGTFVLSQYNGGLSENFENTLFDQAATPSNSIPGFSINAPTNLNAYFRGIYRPQTGTVFPTGVNAAGTWTLQVYDNQPGDAGVLRKWGLLFNKYAKFKDVRWGWDVNIFNATRYPAPYIDNLVAYGPTGAFPYRTLGARPMNNTALFVGAIQNSRLPSLTRITLATANPNQGFVVREDFDAGLNPNVYPYVAQVQIPTATGNVGVRADLYQRGDMYMTRNDNRTEKSFALTPGTLGYDNGKAAGSTNIAVGNCEASVFRIEVPQTLTSVDFWQGSGVELEPVNSNARVSVRVYNAASGTPTTLVASTGLRKFPAQGQKWVTYEFDPPVALQAGTYAFSLCTDVPPTTGGTNMGLDQEGSPFDMEGPLSRYYNMGIEWFSQNNGTAWSPDFTRIFGGKMIRPNFITASDVGVVSIDYPPANLPASFAPVVTFASYANHPSLPNLIALAKLYVVDNSTNHTVRYSERRVFMQNVPFSTSVTFDNFSGLAAGSYTIRVELERSDDENLNNNVYSRTYTKTFAPITVSHRGPLSNDVRENILSAYAGSNVVFVDRMIKGNVLPEGGNVLWIGEIGGTEAMAIRSYVDNGNNFSVLPGAGNTDILTGVYTSLANTQERQKMDNAISMAKSARPQFDAFPTEYESLFSENVIGDKAAFAQSVSDLRTRQQASATLSKSGVDNREVVFSQSENLTVTAERIGALSIVRVGSSHAKTPQSIVEEMVAPTGFELAQNYPNPFNPSTTISYTLPADASVNLRVYDMLGREVATLVNATQNAGRFLATWDGLDNARQAVSSGVYLYRLEAAPFDGTLPFIMTKKMVLTR